MSLTLRKRVALLAVLVGCSVAGQAVMAETASAVTVAKGDLKNGELRIEGRGHPGVIVIASSTTDAAGIRADPAGAFKIQASNFTAPDCKVVVWDGRTPTATVSLPSCTPSVKPVPPTPAAPTGSCAITPEPPAAFTVDTLSVFNFDTTGCDTTFDSGATPTPVQWTVVAGSIPTGMSGPFSQGTTAGNIVGAPTVPGTYSFTLEVTDQVGATDQETFTITVS